MHPGHCLPDTGHFRNAAGRPQRSENQTGGGQRPNTALDFEGDDGALTPSTAAQATSYQVTSRYMNVT
jgi:hypothetical protein